MFGGAEGRGTLYHRHIIGGYQKGAWFVEETYDVASEDVRCLLDCSKPPGNAKAIGSCEDSHREVVERKRVR